MMLSLTLLAVLVKKTTAVHLYKTSLLTAFWLIKQYHYKCSVHILYISAPLVKALYEPKHILIPTHVEVEIL